MWLPMKLAIQLEILNKREDVGLVYCGTIEIDEKGCLKKIRYASTKRLHNLWMKNFIGTLSTVMVRKEVFDRCGLFDVNLEAKEDYDLYLRIAQNYGISAYKIPLVIRREHQDQITKDLRKRIVAHHYFLTKHVEIQRSRKAYAYQLSDLAHLYLRIGDYKNGLYYARQSIGLYPRVSLFKKILKAYWQKVIKK